MARKPIKEYLQQNPNAVLVLDGGHGTELENRGIDVNHPVWSTIPFIDDSFWSDQSSNDREIVKSMFHDFLAAGSGVLMTTTYQTSFKSVCENTSIKTLREYNELLNNIVKFSRDCIGDEKYLIGTIGPWGAHICAEFSGNYGEYPEQIKYYEYFKPQLDNFFQNDNLDIIGFETTPNVHELKAVLSWDESILSKPYYIGLSVDKNGLLRDGTSIKDIANIIKSLGDKINPNLIFLGVNCVSFVQSPEIVDSLHIELPDMPLIVYPNSDGVYDTVKKVWVPNTNSCLTWDDLVKRYISSGVRIIGGCCRTSPKDIQEIAEAVKKYSK